MMTKERSTKIVKFMTPGEGVLVLGHSHISNIVKMNYFFKKIFFSTLPGIDQTKYIVMMIKKGQPKLLISFKSLE